MTVSFTTVIALVLAAELLLWVIGRLVRVPPAVRGSIQAAITLLVAIWLLESFGIFGGAGRHR